MNNFICDLGTFFGLLKSIELCLQREFENEKNMIFDEQQEIAASNTWLIPMLLGIAKVGTEQNWRASAQNTSMLAAREALAWVSGSALQPETISMQFNSDYLSLAGLTKFTRLAT